MSVRRSSRDDIVYRQGYVDGTMASMAEGREKGFRECLQVLKRLARATVHQSVTRETLEFLDEPNMGERLEALLVLRGAK